MDSLNLAKITVRLVVVAIAIGVLVLIGCEGKTSNEYCLRVRHFTGVVRDSASQMPLDSAVISLIDTVSGVSALADSTGQYQISSSGCDIQFFARKNGYVTEQRWLHGITEDVSNLNFELTRK